MDYPTSNRRMPYSHYSHHVEPSSFQVQQLEHKTRSLTPPSRSSEISPNFNENGNGGILGHHQTSRVDTSYNQRSKPVIPPLSLGGRIPSRVSPRENFSDYRGEKGTSNSFLPDLYRQKPSFSDHNTHSSRSRHLDRVGAYEQDIRGPDGSLSGGRRYNKGGMDGMNHEQSMLENEKDIAHLTVDEESRNISSKGSTCVCPANAYMARKGMLLDAERKGLKQEKSKLVKEQLALSALESVLKQKQSELNSQQSQLQKDEISLSNMKQTLLNQEKHVKEAGKKCEERLNDYNALYSSLLEDQRQAKLAQRSAQERQADLDKQEAALKQKSMQLNGLREQWNKRQVAVEDDALALERQKTKFQAECAKHENEANALMMDKTRHNNEKENFQRNCKSEMEKIRNREKEVERRQEECHQTLANLERTKLQIEEASNRLKSNEAALAEQKRFTRNAQMELENQRKMWEKECKSRAESFRAESENLQNEYHEFKRNCASETERFKNEVEAWKYEKSKIEEEFEERADKLANDQAKFKSAQKQQIECFNEEKESSIRMIEKRNNELDCRQSELEELSLSLEREKCRLEEGSKENELRKTELDKTKNEVDVTISNLHNQELELKDRLDDLNNRLNEVSYRESQIMELEQQLKLRESRSRNEAAELENRANELMEIEKSLKEREELCAQLQVNQEKVSFAQEMIDIESKAVEAHKSDLHIDYEQRLQTVHAKQRELANETRNLEDRERLVNQRMRELERKEKAFNLRLKKAENPTQELMTIPEDVSTPYTDTNNNGKKGTCGVLKISATRLRHHQKQLRQKKALADKSKEEPTIQDEPNNRDLINDSIFEEPIESSPLLKPYEKNETSERGGGDLNHNHNHHNHNHHSHNHHSHNHHLLVRSPGPQKSPGRPPSLTYSPSETDEDPDRLKPSCLNYEMKQNESGSAAFDSYDWHEEHHPSYPSLGYKQTELGESLERPTSASHAQWVKNHLDEKIMVKANNNVVKTPQHFSTRDTTREAMKELTSKRYDYQSRLKESEVNEDSRSYKMTSVSSENVLCVDGNNKTSRNEELATYRGNPELLGKRLNNLRSLANTNRANNSNNHGSNYQTNYHHQQQQQQNHTSAVSSLEDKRTTQWRSDESDGLMPNRDSALTCMSVFRSETQKDKNEYTSEQLAYTRTTTLDRKNTKNNNNNSDNNNNNRQMFDFSQRSNSHQDNAELYKSTEATHSSESDSSSFEDIDPPNRSS